VEERVYIKKALACAYEKILQQLWPTVVKKILWKNEAAKLFL